MEEKESKIKSFFKRLFNKDSEESGLKQGKVKMAIAVVLMIVIVLIFASSFTSEKSNNSQSSSKEVQNNLSAVEYCEVVENRLVNVLKNIKGVGAVDVFVMVDSSPTIKFLEETSTTTNKNGDSSTETIQTTIVMAKDGSLSQPVVMLELMPKITGVLVVASGAKDIKMKTTLVNVISSVLSVNISNVEVLEGKS